MRWSQSFVPTLRDDPADAEAVSHKLMVRAGMVRQLAAGIYVYLPVGQRVLDKVTDIIRQEMNAIGGQEIAMPVLHPAEIWQQSGRWGAIGDEMFRLKDRNQRDLCLGMTHEEVVAWLASKEIRSYRDLPQIWYQIQTKERDEARPRSGVLRTREFLMKDSYTLDRDEAGLNNAYERHLTAYRKIFERCGLRYHVVESDPGMMGGAGAHEFMAPSPAGEDEIACCSHCGHAANVELARSVPPAPKFPAWALEEVATPNAKTIDEVAAFLKVSKELTIKSLLYIGKDGPLLALVRGDQQLHEKKLAKVAGDVRPAHPDEVRSHMGASPGSIGPVGASVTILTDDSLKDGVYVVGANRDGSHLKGVKPGQDFQTRFLDLHVARAGDGCAECGAPLTVARVIEVGNIFKLGTKYTVPFHAFYLDQDGQERPIVMGSYGIGPARIVAASIEQHHDTNGIIWPWSIAPVHVHVLAVNVNDALQRDTAEELYQTLTETGLEVFLDDRDERPGVKFKDADLIGAPIRITVGTAFIKSGTIELRARRDGSDRKVLKTEVVPTIKQLAQTLQ